jgi:hypothetical protein
MIKQQGKNHQATSNSSALQGGKSLPYSEFHKQASVFRSKAVYHGASGITSTLLSMIFVNTPIGLSFRSIAVRMMVIITATLRLPRSVILPKVIFLNMTAFLIACSAALLVGGIIGYSRNTVISHEGS